ncbi:homoserine dehydrogenase [Ruminococcaceae bacterium OttesenSCG-928-A16]|nr:homoserine dehydrogenase [Ruminococcaceae bacterium OttesenSCG-928-A16]
MAKLAILGFGTVGSGVLQVLRQNQEVVRRRLGAPLEVKYICDIRDFSESEDAALFVKDFEQVLSDPEVELVVETIGGTNPAYNFVTRALESGRHVVTSNKELVATYGDVLLQKAKQHNVCFLFEASVGGGMPLITPMYQSMAANHLLAVQGIVNGTTNYMLTCMEKEGLDFDTALQQAQSLGYAETIDPSSDVDGIDAGRKIAILAAIAFGKHVYPQNVPTRGIRAVTPADIQAGQQMGRAVKLVAWAAKAAGGNLQCGVEPMLVSSSNLLAGVEDVFNAVAIQGDMLGEVLFYGKGAGKLPTASAVVADAMDALQHGPALHNNLFWLPAPPIEGQYQDTGRYNYYLRPTKPTNLQMVLQQPNAKPIPGVAAAMLEAYSAEELASTVAALAGQGVTTAITMKLLD